MLCLALVGAHLQSAEAQELRYAVFPAPPYMIFQPGKPEAATGIDVEIVQEIASRLGLKLTVVECPWKRCLNLMELGEIDILSSVYRKPERELYMAYLNAPYLKELQIAFYSRANDNLVIGKYEDLHAAGSIGVLKGASYFPRFDSDTTLNKVEVTSQDQLFPMLVHGHLDVVAGYVPTENYRLTVEGYSSLVKKSEYTFSEEAKVYMAISKNSPLMSRLQELNSVNTELLDQGIISRIVSSHYAKYSRAQ